MGKKKRRVLKVLPETTLSLYGPTDVQEKNINCFEITLAVYFVFF